MTDKDRILRMLTIRPEDLSKWAKLCRGVQKQVAAAHPDYPILGHAQLMSMVKRLLPEIRAMILAGETTGLYLTRAVHASSGTNTASRFGAVIR